MKKLFHVISIIIFCMLINPVFANDADESDDNETTNLKRESSVKEIDNSDDGKTTSGKRNNSKNKKGERNVKVQPNKKEDENIILELDRT